ncbi:hypothetical protein [Staphylococcus shinii]|uniref:hypothetical protein n=1 Tax=Staphylococcus shinii TaxID=2912228 RepID=UPI003EEC61A6
MEQKQVYTLVYSETFGGLEFIGVYDNQSDLDSAIQAHMVLVDNVDWDDETNIKETIEEEYRVISSLINEADYQELH